MINICSLPFLDHINEWLCNLFFLIKSKISYNQVALLITNIDFDYFEISLET